jgi:hypothetical protein
VTLPADSDFSTYAIELYVPPPAAKLQFGVGLAGPGEIWVAAPSVVVEPS